MAAMLIAMAHLAYAPRSALARCGDYVMLGGHGTQHLAPATETIAYQSPFFETPASTHPTAHQVPDSRPLHSGRCTGPMCSNNDNDPRPLGSPTVPGESEAQQWGLIAVEWSGAAVVPQFVRFTDDPILPHIAAGSVYRPPR
jgi:hypothetical protein